MSQQLWGGRCYWQVAFAFAVPGVVELGLGFCKIGRMLRVKRIMDFFRNPFAFLSHSAIFGAFSLRARTNRDVSTIS